MMSRHDTYIDKLEAKLVEVEAERDALAARLDTLLAAIGDPDELRMWAEVTTPYGRKFMERVAAAASPDTDDRSE
jgi:hypothetical protein